MAVESKLRDIRHSHHETQKDVAFAIEVDPKTIRNIETTGTCSLEVALRLSAYYNLSVNSLFSVTDPFNSRKEG